MGTTASAGVLTGEYYEEWDTNDAPAQPFLHQDVAIVIPLRCISETRQTAERPGSERSSTGPACRPLRRATLIEGSTGSLNAVVASSMHRPIIVITIATLIRFPRGSRPRSGL